MNVKRDKIYVRWLTQWLACSEHSVCLTTLEAVVFEAV